jgi:hypothetical protein
MKVIAICQYRENYAFNSDGSINSENPHWKNKGSHEFIFDLKELNIDSMTYINCSNEIKQMITEIVAEQCNEIAQYTLLSVEPQFEEPTNLTKKLGEKFYSLDYLVKTE